MKRNAVILMLAVLFAAGCSKKGLSGSEDYMVFDDIEYVDAFPTVEELAENTPLSLDVLGVTNLYIRDSLMILTTQDATGYWAFLSLPDMNNLGKFLTRGNGPGEFHSAPRAANQQYKVLNGDLVSTIYDFSSGKVYDMNIGSSLRRGVVDIAASELSLPSNILTVNALSDGKLLCKELSPAMNSQVRCVLSEGVREIPDALVSLNSAVVAQGSDFNILNTFTKTDPKGDKVVEAAMYLNQINLYSPYEKSGKTICVGDKVDNIDLAQQLGKADRKSTYVYLCAYPDFFAAAYVNETQENLHFKRGNKFEIQFFDWNGKPLAKAVLPKPINAFDIDFNASTLYTLDYETEEMYAYDLTDFLSRF